MTYSGWGSVEYVAKYRKSKSVSLIVTCDLLCGSCLRHARHKTASVGEASMSYADFDCTATSFEIEALDDNLSRGVSDGRGRIVHVSVQQS